jgi:hypothetical protein
MRPSCHVYPDVSAIAYSALECAGTLHMSETQSEAALVAQRTSRHDERRMEEPPAASAASLRPVDLWGGPERRWRIADLGAVRPGRSDDDIRAHRIETRTDNLYALVPRVHNGMAGFAVFEFHAAPLVTTMASTPRPAPRASRAPWPGRALADVTVSCHFPSLLTVAVVIAPGRSRTGLRQRGGQPCTTRQSSPSSSESSSPMVLWPWARSVSSSPCSQSPSQKPAPWRFRVRMKSWPASS